MIESGLIDKLWRKRFGRLKYKEVEAGGGVEARAFGREDLAMPAVILFSGVIIGVFVAAVEKLVRNCRKEKKACSAISNRSILAGKT